MARVAELVSSKLSLLTDSYNAQAKTLITPVYNVVGYGAKGDGVTNDSAAIQSAIDAAALNGGGIVFFPGGTYLADFTISSDNIHLVGAGQGVTIIKKTSSAASSQAIKITGDHCSVRSLTVRGQSAATYVAGERGIYILGTDDAARVAHVVVENVEVADIGAYGIQSLYGDNVYVKNCYVHNVGYMGISFFSTNNGNAILNHIDTITPGTEGNAYGISYSNTGTNTRPKFGGAFFNKIENVTIWEGIDTHGGYGIRFIGNEIKNCMYGINLSPDSSANNAPDYCQAIGNVIDIGTVSSPGRAIGSGGYSPSLISKGIVVADNVVIGYGLGIDYEGAIMFKYTQGLRIHGNLVKNSVGVGICVNIENTQVSVTNNTVDGVSPGTAGNHGGIKVRQAGNTGYIGENVIDATAEYGIVLNSSCPSMEFGHNRIVTSNATKILSASNGGPGIELFTTVTVDPASIATGAGLTLQLTNALVGAAFGDSVEVTAPYSLGGLSMTPYVSAANTVAVRLENNTGAAVDLPSGSWKIKVKRI